MTTNHRNDGIIGLELLDYAPYVAHAVDPDQAIRYWNPVAERILGPRSTVSRASPPKWRDESRV